MRRITITPLLDTRPVQAQLFSRAKQKHESATSSPYDMEERGAAPATASSLSGAITPEHYSIDRHWQNLREKPTRGPFAFRNAIDVGINADRSNDVSSSESDSHDGTSRPHSVMSQHVSNHIIGRTENDSHIRTLEDRLRELHEVNFELTERLGRMGGMAEDSSGVPYVLPPVYTPANQ